MCRRTKADLGSGIGGDVGEGRECRRRAWCELIVIESITRLKDLGGG
jgi:hypothetical protein